MKAPFGWRCPFRASEDVSQGGASNGRQKSKGVLFCRVCQGLPFTLPWVVGHRSISLPTKLAAHRGVSVPPAALRRHVRVPGALPRLAWTDPPLSFPFRAMFGTVLTIRRCCCFAKGTASALLPLPFVHLTLAVLLPVYLNLLKLASVSCLPEELK